MRSDSLNIIPSFDSIPPVPKSHLAYSHEMKLIVSEMEIKSFKFLDDNVNNNLRASDEVEELSI